MSDKPSTRTQAARRLSASALKEAGRRDIGLVVQPPHSPARPTVRLNGLQRAMLSWECSHPVNAVHALELGTAVDTQSVLMRLPAIAAEIGLGPVQLSKWSTRMTYAPPARPLQVSRERLEHAGAAAVTEAINAELAAPFRDGDWPVRIQLLTTPTGARHLLVTYRHAIADGWSMALLVKRGLGGDAADSPSVTQPDNDRLIALNARSWRDRGQDAGETLRSAARRGGPRWRGAEDSCPVSQEVAAGISLPDLRGLAQCHGVTINDLLIAALIDALATVRPDWLTSRRDRLTVQLPVNLRNSDSRLEFAQSLGSLLLDIRPRNSDFSGLVRDVAGITRQAKARRADVDGLAAFDWIMTAAACVPKGLGVWAARRICPLAASISNLNLVDLFAEESRLGLVKSYSRSTSPGELIPLIITLTSLGTEFGLRATYRREVLSDDQMTEVGDRLIRRLQK